MTSQVTSAGEPLSASAARVRFRWRLRRRIVLSGTWLETLLHAWLHPRLMETGLKAHGRRPSLRNPGGLHSMLRVRRKTGKRMLCRAHVGLRDLLHLGAHGGRRGVGGVHRAGVSRVLGAVGRVRSFHDVLRVYLGRRVLFGRHGGLQCAAFVVQHVANAHSTSGGRRLRHSEKK